MAMARASIDSQTQRRSSWPILAYAIGSLSLAATFAAFVVQLRDSPPVDDRYNLSALDGLLAATIAVTGMLIGGRRPANAIGWLFLFSAAWGAFGNAETGYLRHALVAQGTTYVAPPALQSSLSWGWVLLVIPVVAFVPMYFPSGRLLSGHWRPMPVLGLVGGLGIVLAIALSPVDRQSTSDPGSAYGAVSGANPYAIDAPWVQPLLIVSFALVLVAILLAVASLIVRMRRGTQVERQQLKVFFYAAVLWPLLIVPAGLTGSPLLQLLVILGIVAVPVAVTFAILRYRLYDIDILIRRTLIYAMLSAALLVTYLVGVALIQFALAPITSGNGLAVAISTLTVVALFQPLRRRIQTNVDRRFYRQKFDAALTLDHFASRLREEIDLDALQVELLGVVGDALQPAQVSLWLRDRQNRPPRTAA